MESGESIKALVEYANDAGVTVVSDEVYEHFIYGKKHWSAARFGDNVITINAASKTYAMTGWRLGYLAASPEIVGQCLKVHQYCQACATSISQYAALAAYTGDQAPVRQMRDEYRARRDLLCKGLFDIGFSFPVPEGAFYAFVPMKPALVQKIIDSGVILTPGSAFGANAPDYARLSYAASRENLMRALDRIRKATGVINMVKELLRKLSNAHGVSGSEGSVFAVIKKELKGHVDEITEDPMGNLIAVKHGNKSKVMLAAHMDEIGLMVKYIDDKGFLRFITLGGWYAPTLYNQRVIVHGTKGDRYRCHRRQTPAHDGRGGAQERREDRRHVHRCRGTKQGRCRGTRHRGRDAHNDRPGVHRAREQPCHREGV